MRRSDKLKNIERANLLAEQRHLESKGVLTEGIIDKVKDILIGPINDLIDKLGDKGQEVYNKLVDSFGENPSMDTIKAKVQSELNEDRDFGKLGLMDDPKYADKEGKQNTTDKIMGVLSQIIGFNLSALGGVPLAAAITVMLGLPVIGGIAIGGILSLIISFIIKGLADRYGHARAKQLDEATNLLAEQRYLKSKGLLKEADGDEQKKIELVGQMTKEMGKRLASEIKKMGIEGNGYQMGIKGEGLSQYLEMTFNTAVVDYHPQFSDLETEYLNHLSKGLVQERGLGGEYKQFVNTSDPSSIKWQIKYTPPEQLQGDQQQAGNPEKLELGENISGIGDISVEIKHDNGETVVKGRVEPTDIGFVIYNENQDGRPFNIVWKEKLNKFVSGESMWYDEQDVVATSGYEDAFNKLEASYGKTDLKEGQRNKGRF